VLRDVQMHEQAGIIQAEVQAMLKDVLRLDERVGKLQRHFDQASEDMRHIRISTEKVTKRGESIERIELGDDDDAAEELETPVIRLEEKEN
jgi:DNA recombination protein RmuC